MTRYDLNNQYFEWLYDLVCNNRYSRNVSYRKLLMYLHSTEFRYSIPMDRNRAKSGENLRWRFALEQASDDAVELSDELDGPCSVLEMIVALAIYCEEHVMDDPAYGNRMCQWFWDMIANLGLGSMTDNHFDRRKADEIIQRFLDREYEPDGRGGLFTIRGCDRDLRDVEIFYQLCWYLNSII